MYISSSHIAVKVFEIHADFYLTLIFGLFFFLYKTFVERLSKQTTLSIYLLFYYGLSQFVQYRMTNEIWALTTQSVWVPYLAKFAIIIAWFIYTIYLYIFNNEVIEDSGERMFCVDTALAGSIFIVSAQDYIDMYLALEVIAFATYVIVASDRSRYSAESALKYFIYSVFGSFLLVIGFNYGYSHIGQTFIDLGGVLGFKGIHFDIILIFWLSVFFAKLGIGMFYFWVAPVYQGVSSYAFIFLSVISKMIIIFPFFFLWGLSGTQSGGIYYYYLTFTVIFASWIVSRKLYNERNFRRIAAYSSVLNFGIATLGLFNGQFSFHIFTAFVTLYLVGALATYTWHVILNAHSDTGQEVTAIGDFKFSNPIGNTMIKVCLIINSGLPPITLFLYKIDVLGMVVSAVNELSFSKVVIGVIIIIANVVLYYIYFITIKELTFTKEIDNFTVTSGLRCFNHDFFYMGVFTMLLICVAFFLTYGIIVNFI